MFDCFAYIVFHSKKRFYCVGPGFNAVFEYFPYIPFSRMSMRVCYVVFLSQGCKEISTYMLRKPIDIGSPIYQLAYVY